MKFDLSHKEVERLISPRRNEPFAEKRLRVILRQILFKKTIEPGDSETVRVTLHELKRRRDFAAEKRSTPTK